MDERAGLTFRGRLLGDVFGDLRRSEDAVGDRDELWRRMEADGYLYLPGLLPRYQVWAARREVMERLARRGGVLDEGHPAVEGVAAPGAVLDTRATGPEMPRLVQGNEPLHRVLYDGAMIDFYRFFLGGSVRHFDHTWFRARVPGIQGPTAPHCDIVFMGRGTRDLFTSWTPFGQVPYQMGGLMILEGSHRAAALADYCRGDVDLYCENDGDAAAVVGAARPVFRPLSAAENKAIQWNSSGAFSADAIAVQEQLGGRWLTAEYEPGDVLVFSMFTLHASPDNRSERVRISADTRYQLAAAAIDARWVGAEPPGHGIRAKRGMIC